MKNTLQIVIFIIAFRATGFTQSDSLKPYFDPTLDINYRDKTSLGIIAGWHQFKYCMMELGIGFANSDWGHHGNLFHAASISAEINPWNNVYACKISIWKSIPLIPISLGINGLYYQQFEHYDWTIRPMLGIGFENIHFTYSYDIPLDKREIIKRNTHMFSLRYYLPIIKLNK